MSTSPEFGVWMNMSDRCYNTAADSYHNYGGRGIQVCAAWRKSFEAFYTDMGPRPSANHSIDRIDNDGDYAPGNCRWATPIEQSRNRRTTRLITFGNRTQSLTEWAAELGITSTSLDSRLKRWSLERALTQEKAA